MGDYQDTTRDLISPLVLNAIIELEKDSKEVEPINADAYTFIKNTIEGDRHQGYSKKVKRQKWYRAVTSTDKDDLEDYRSYIRSYSVRETPQQLEARREISIPVTSGVIGKLEAFIKPALRQPKSKNSIKAGNDSQTESFLNAVSSFGNHGESLLKWVEDVSVIKNMGAPNDYVLVKFKPQSNTCYPEIIKAENILNIRRSDQGDAEVVEISYLCVPYDEDSAQDVKISQYRHHYLGMELSFTEVSEQDKIASFYQRLNAVDFAEIDGIKYMVSVRKKPMVPLVFPFGYIVDYNNYEELFLPYWHKASHKMDECIQDGSKYCVAKYRHLYMQTVTYAEDCKHSEGGSVCQGGTLVGGQRNGETCPKCKGSGKVGIMDGDMDKIMLTLPPEGMAGLSVLPKDLTHYVDVPIDIVELLREITEKYHEVVSMEVYGIDMGQSAKGMITATQVLQEQGTGHSVVIDFLTSGPTRLYKNIAKAIAGFLDIQNPVIEYEYARDVSIVTVDDLIDRLDKARKAGAPQSVIDSIVDSLEEKQQMNMSRDNAIQKALDNHKPFAHLPDREALNAVLNLSQGDPRRVLWENFTQVCAQVKEDSIGFAELGFAQQVAVIEPIVQEYIQAANERAEQELAAISLEAITPQQEQEDEGTET